MYCGSTPANYITGVRFPRLERNPNWHYCYDCPPTFHTSQNPSGKDTQIPLAPRWYWPAFLCPRAIVPRSRIASMPTSSCFQPRGREMVRRSLRQCRRSLQSCRSIWRSIRFRYVFLREVPFGQDGNLYHEAIVARINDADPSPTILGQSGAALRLSMIAKSISLRAAGPGTAANNDKAPDPGAGDGMIALARTAWATQQIHVKALMRSGRGGGKPTAYFRGEARGPLGET